MLTFQSNLLSQLTLVIPSYNRPAHLEQLIEFWRETPVKIHILDGSERRLFKIGALSGIPTINYYHLPATDRHKLSKNYAERIRIAATLPDTPYSAMLGDDDFLSLSGVSSCLQVLAENQNICSVFGVSIGFEKSDQGIGWGLREVEPTFDAFSESSVVSTRLKPIKVNAGPRLYYGIFRSSTWKKTFALSYGPDFSINIGGERLVEAVAVALGPVKKVDQIVSIRRFYTNRENFEAFENKRGSYEKYLADNRNQDEVHKLYEVLTEAIQLGSPDLKPDQARTLSKSVLRPGFRTTELGLLYWWRKYLVKILGKLGSLLHPSIRLTLNRLLSLSLTRSLGFTDVKPDLIPLTQKMNIKIFCLEIAKTKIVFDESEIRSIQKLLLKPREELRLRADI